MAKNQLMIKGVRCIYPQLGQARVFEGQTEDQTKYSVKILIPKTDKTTVKQVTDFFTNQVKESNLKPGLQKQALTTAKNNEDPLNDNAILKDGDLLNQRREDEEKEPIDAYKDHYVIGLNRRASFGQPGVFDENAEPVPPFAIADTVKSGYWINVQVSAYCYAKPKAGVTLQLQNVQFVKLDEVFGMSNPFAPVESDEDDADMDVDL